MDKKENLKSHWPGRRKWAGMVFFRAVQSGDVACVRDLVRSASVDVNVESDTGDYAVHIAALRDDARMMEALFSLGARADVTRFKNGYTPLMTAAARAGEAVVKAVLAVDGNIDRRAGEDAATALMVAVECRSYKAVRLLLAAGADPHLANIDGDSAFDIAKYNRDAKMQELLQGRGQKPAAPKLPFGR